MADIFEDCNVVDPNMNKINRYWIECDSIGWGHLQQELRDCLMPICNLDVVDLINKLNILITAGLNIRERKIIEHDDILNGYFDVNYLISSDHLTIIIFDDYVYMEGKDFTVGLDDIGDKKRIDWGTMVGSTLNIANGDKMEVLYVTTADSLGL